MKKIFTFIIIIFLVGIFFWWSHGNAPVDSKNTTQKTFSVAKGQGLKETAKRLQDAGLITDWLVFYLIAKGQHLDNNLQAGDFTLSPSMSASQIAQALTHSNSDIRITAPEGKRAEEIADILQQHMPNFQDSWRKTLNANEGYLFPDTYFFQKDATIDEIVAKMRKNFDDKYATLQVPSSQRLTQEHVVTLASIVEREARSEHDMAYVASTFENRLNQGMPLGSDVTLEYALGYQANKKTWWKEDLTVNDLALKTPYNTRLVTGLPPTPISNPGLTALNAVVNAPPSNYLYFLADKNGIVHFAKTHEEHLANIQKYGVN